MQVKPTRMELLKLKKRIALAKKGHRLLKEKRDALFSEFYNQLESTKKLRREAEELLNKAHTALSVANVQFGSAKVTEFSVISSRNAEIELNIGSRNIMGVEVPVVKSSGMKRGLLERGYSLVESGSAVDEASELFEQSLEKIALLAEKEAGLSRLAFEINRTRRKVNSLEKIAIPKMEALAEQIMFRLDERERETIFTMKKVKKKIDAKNIYG